MKITEVRIFTRDNSDDKVKAYVSVTFEDAFVVRDLKILEGVNGLLVVMPSRRMHISCSECGYKNRYKSRFCNQCGKNIEKVSQQIPVSRKEEYRDIAHPINTEMRNYMQGAIIKAYEEHIKHSGNADKADMEEIS